MNASLGSSVFILPVQNLAVQFFTFFSPFIFSLLAKRMGSAGWF